MGSPACKDLKMLNTSEYLQMYSSKKLSTYRCTYNFAFFLLLAMCLCLLSVLMCYICNIRNVKFKYTVLCTGIGEFNKVVSKADKVVSKNIFFIHSQKLFLIRSFKICLKRPEKLGIFNFNS